MSSVRRIHVDALLSKGFVHLLPSFLPFNGCPFFPLICSFLPSFLARSLPTFFKLAFLPFKLSFLPSFHSSFLMVFPSFLLYSSFSRPSYLACLLPFLNPSPFLFKMSSFFSSFFTWSFLLFSQFFLPSLFASSKMFLPPFYPSFPLSSFLFISSFLLKIFPSF